MLIKRFIICNAVAMFALPVLAHATDMTFTNHTNVQGTATLKSSPCSSRAGASGIAQPGQTLSVSNSVMGQAFTMFCFPSDKCDAHVFASNNCSGSEIATVTISKSQGVVDVKNKDNSQYTVRGNGKNITLENVSGLKAFFNNLL